MFTREENIRRVVEPGPGDLLAWRPLLAIRLRAWLLPPLLVEVKATANVPWASSAHFGPDARREMLEARTVYGVEPLLAWWPPHLRGGPIWLPPEDWPR